MNTKKNVKVFALTMLTSFLLLALFSSGMTNVRAQAQGTITILDSIGGTTDPAAGTYNYADGTSVTIAATPTDPTYIFQNWVVSTDAGSSTVTDNPLVIPAVAGVTYTIQPIFIPVQAPPGAVLPSDLTTAAIVVVLASAGGTTTPPPGTYAIDNAKNLMLTATPNSGWQFVHWVISGATTSHGGEPVNLTPTDNPYNVNHGYGYTFNYQPVFIPTGSTQPTPSGGATPTPTGTIGGLSTETVIIIALVVVIIIILAAFGAYALRRRK